MKTFIRDFLSLVKQAWQKFQYDEAEQLGAALAYYAMFSIMPLLLLILAAFGAVLGSQDDVQASILNIIARTFSPQLGDTVEQILAVITQQSGTATLIGTLTLLLGASGVFQQLEKAFNKIWNIRETDQAVPWHKKILKMLRERLFAFLMVLIVGFLLLFSMIVTGVTNILLSTLSGVPVVGSVFGYIVGVILSIILSSLIFALTYRYLPHAPITWQDVLPGAIFMGILWEGAKRVLALYIERSAFTSAYGIIGTVLVLMVWIYLSSQVLFFGAEFTKIYSQQRKLRVHNANLTTAAPTDDRQLE